MKRFSSFASSLTDAEQYYLDFTVTFGQDEFRARVPIRIT